MSVQDTASALVDLFYSVGLPWYKADILRQFSLNSESVYENSLCMLYLFLHYVKYGQLQSGMNEPVKKKNSEYIIFIDEFLVSRLSPVRICRINEANAILNLVLLTWCLTDSNMAYMPERFFPQIYVGFSEENVTELHKSCQPVKKLKGCFLSISGVISAISIKETGLHLLFKTLMNQPYCFFDERFLQLNMPFQRNVTFLELVYILDIHKYAKTPVVKKVKQFLDLLSKWIRNSAAFYRWLRFSSGNVHGTTSSLPSLHDGERYVDDLVNTYGGLESFKSILMHCAPNPETMTIATFNRNDSVLQEEYKRRLDYAADYMKTTLYSIFPTSNYSVISEKSSSPLCFNAKTEKQVLQSLVSSLNNLYCIRRERIHSRLMESYRVIIPSVSCLHKSVPT